MYYAPKTTAELISAIQNANINGQADVISLRPGYVYVLDHAEDTTDTYGPSGLPKITSEIVIIGNGAIIKRSATAPDGFRLIRVTSGGILKLQGLVLSDGNLQGVADPDTSGLHGGAISNEGTLTIIQCILKNNKNDMSNGYGGAIYTANGSTLTIQNSQIINNEGTAGAGIDCDGTMDIQNSIIANNSGTLNGGIGGLGTVTVKNCRLQGNYSQDGAALRWGVGSLTVTYCDIIGNWANNSGGCIFIDSGGTPTVILNYNRILNNYSLNTLLTKTDLYNAATPSVDARFNWWGSSSGPSGSGSGVGDSVGTNIDYSQWLLSEDCLHEAICDCPINHAASDCYASPNPISLRFGEKRVEETDLSVQSPAGPLAFTRLYRQDKLTDPDFQFMGLGWTHEHDIRLSDPGSHGNITVITPKGGKVSFKFSQTLTGIDYYNAEAGSASTMTVDSSSSTARYTLTAADQAKFIFDSNKKLRTRQWPNNETWTVDYYTSTDGADLDGKLKQVSDGYNRNLQFAYYRDTETSVYKRRQLRYVGDHTASGLQSGTPSGRFITLDYTPEMVNQTPITNPKALLYSVLDVRGNLWTYSYYGQGSGETTAEQLNWLINRFSPSVDTTGDGVNDGNLTLEQVVYGTHVVELAVNGDMELDSDWIDVGTPPTHQRSNIRAFTGTYSRRVIADAVGEGIQGNLWQLAKGRKYTITAHVYIVPPSGGTSTVKMQVTGTTAFDQSTSVTASWQTLTVANYIPTTTNEVKLQFIATALGTGGTTQFYVDAVSIQETNLQITQKRGFQGAGTPALQTVYKFVPGLNYTLEEVATKTTKHLFDRGLYGGQQNPAGQVSSQKPNSQFRSEYQLDANGNPTWMNWSADGKYLNSVVDALGNQTSFDFDAANNRLNYSLDAQGRKTDYTYGDVSNPRQPTRIKVFDINGTTVLRWQEFTYDSKGRTLTEKNFDPANGTTLLQQTTRTYGTSGNSYGLLESVTQVDTVNPGNNQTTTYTYDSAGRVIKTQLSSLLGTCQFSYSVYDAVGNVVATVCSRVSVTPPTTVSAAIAMYDATDPDKSRVTTHEYDAMGRRTKTTADAGATFARTTLTFYDALSRVVRTIDNYINQSGGAAEEPALWVWDATDGRWEKPSGTAISFGTNNDQNVISTTEHNARGMVRRQRDALGVVSLFGYDDAGRLVKTIQSASLPNYNNDYSGVSPDPTLGSYSASGSVDKDIITAQTYDAAGNLVKVVDALLNVHYTVYDALNRPVKTVRAAKAAATISLNPGDGGYDETNDPRSANYAPATSPDRDLIEVTEYDAMGRVVRTQRLLDNRPTPQWETMLYGYDPLGRQVKVIRSAATPNYDLTADPALSSYSASSSADLDIVSKTSYDTTGRVLETEDALGAKTRLVYDGLGRQVRTIANYVAQGASDPKDWIWDATDGRWEYPTNNPVSFGASNDQNIVAETVYDVDGRVQSTRDVLGRVSRNVYDTRGRVVRTVTNFVDQGEDPSLWVWNNGWKKSNGTTAINHGTDSDQNIIGSTVYDAQGRVFQTLDHRNNVTQNVYDSLGRQLKTIANYVVQGASSAVNWLWDAADNRWEDGSGTAISFGSDLDQNRIATTIYDIVGHVVRNRDAAGVETRYEYDTLGRRTKTTVNYVDGVYNSSFPDEDLISTTTYNKGGQVVSTTDTRSTQTAFLYDQAGRRLSITQAASSPLASVAYTCYDKAGRVLRQIANWSNDLTKPAPDAKDGSGNWLFVPDHNGAYNDRDVIVVYTYDQASRTISMTDPVSNITQTAYFKDGQIEALTDPENTVTKYRYDNLRRRVRVVQGYVAQGASDPKDWVWDATDSRWEYPTNNPIAYGTNNDQNIVVDVVYDRAGRVTSQREPRGNLTAFAYDQLNRRKSLTNPLSKVWSTAYVDLTTGKTQVNMTYPGVNGGSSYSVQRDFDRMGRLLSIQYGDPANTPDVKFTYDALGNRSKMSEYSGAGFTSRIRETTLSYDDVHRLASAGFDNDGNGTVDETVSYQYDAGGLRTRLTLPGSLNINYTYDTKGQLLSLTDWDSQKTEFAYDLSGRHIATQRANGLRSRYHHDAAGRLKLLRHTKDFKTFGHFEYQVDKRGNRTQALECLADPTTTTDTTITSTDKGLVLNGSWSDVGGFKESSQLSASLKLLFFGDEATLSMGQGPDHGLYDVYIGGTLWQSFDGYAASASQRDIVVSIGIDTLKLQGEGPHLLEIRQRAEKNKTSTGNKVRFKQLLVVDRTWTQHTIEYAYDNLSRLLEARYNPGVNTAAADADLLRRYQYTYDRAGNRSSQSVALSGGTPTVTNYTYNAANQLTSDGTNTFTYDNNGNNVTGGATWDRANRLLSVFDGMNTTQFKYDGLGNRFQKGIGTNVDKYLLDLQPSLAVVLRETLVRTPSNFTNYNVHTVQGIHAFKDSSGWNWLVQDALGSTRLAMTNSLAVLWRRHFAPYGELFGASGSFGTTYGFTGEQADATGDGLLYLRARYYSQTLGVFTALDPFEGMVNRAMSLNGYLWVEGNVPNAIDPSGKCLVGDICDLITDMNMRVLLGCNEIAPSVSTCSLPENSTDPQEIALQIVKCGSDAHTLLKTDTSGGFAGATIDDNPGLMNNQSGYYRAYTAFNNSQQVPYIIGSMMRIWVRDNLGEQKKVNLVAARQNVNSLILKYDKSATKMEAQATEYGLQGAFEQHPIVLHFMARSRISPLQFYFSEPDPNLTDPAIDPWYKRPSCNPTDQSCLSDKFFTGAFGAVVHEPQDYNTWELGTTE